MLCTPMQILILGALDGSALKTQALADSVCSGDTSRLYRRGSLPELRKNRLVEHAWGIGFFRPDSPPAEFIVKFRAKK
jgi:hypothetical protein